MPASITPSDNDSAPQFCSSHLHIGGGNYAHAPHGTINFHTTNEKVEALKTLNSHTAPDAIYTSKAVSRQDLCTPGTRTFTLQRLKGLATSPDSPDVIWMHGPAGAGKSAIMRTLAKELAKDGLLLASFFFFRSEAQRNTSAPFIPTLAAQAWGALPAIQPHIAQAIQDNHGLFSRPTVHQSPPLLDAPLLAALTPSSHPLTIIVDGLDECTDEGGQTEVIQAMVQLASSVGASANRRVKIFIASRPEYEIQSTFDKLKHHHKSTSGDLNTIGNGATSDMSSTPARDEATSRKLTSNIAVVYLHSGDANIHLFYDEQFDKIRKKSHLPSTWPSKQEIEWLMDKTSGQYSFADVSTRLMYGGNPVERLKLIREGLNDDTLQPFEVLDRLYATVFDQVPGDIRIPALRILRCRLHPGWDSSWNATLEPLLQLPSGFVQSLQPFLSSLINFDQALVPYHASLADFLVDPSRSGKFSLYVDDQALSHTVQRGLLATFQEQKGLTDRQESCFRGLLGTNDFTKGLVTPHPVPSAELASALHQINPSSLRIGSSINLLRFLELLQKQSRSQYLYATRPMLLYSIHYALPRQIMLRWEQRTRSYSMIDQAQVHLVFGLVLSGETPWVHRILRQFVQHLNKDLFAIDSSLGWNLPESFMNRHTFRYHLQTSQNGSCFWRCLCALLQFVSNPSSQERAANIILSGIHSGHFDHSPSSIGTIPAELPSCSACAEVFSMVLNFFLQIICDLIQDENTPVQPQAIGALYCLVRDSEQCWVHLPLLECLANYTLRCLEMPRFRYLPRFLIRSQKRELQVIYKALKRRIREILRRPGGEGDSEDEDESDFKKDHEALPQFIVSQLRNHEDLIRFGLVLVGSLIACFVAMYIML